MASEESDVTDTEVARPDAPGFRRLFMPPAEAYSKRWIPRGGTSPSVSLPQLSPARSSVPPGTLRAESPSRSVKWEPGMAGYQHPGGVVTEEQIKAAISMMASATRMSSMIREPLVIAACERVGVRPEELLPKSRAQFNLVEGRSFAASPEFAEEQWQSYQRRAGKKLALVVRERDIIMQEEEEKKAKEEVAARKQLSLLTSSLQIESSKVAKEERELQKVAQVVALEQETNEHKRERLQAADQRRDERLAARQAAVDAYKRELSQRAAQRQALTVEKAAAIKKMEEDIAVEVSLEWEEKEKRIAAIRENKEKELAAFKAAREQEIQRRVTAAVAKAKQLEQEERERREAALREKVRCTCARRRTTLRCRRRLRCHAVWLTVERRGATRC
jgi:hypothetical protein